MGLSRTASRGEVRVAYRRMAMRLHPDMNADPGAVGEFNYLCEAYRCLSNPEAREAYDRVLAARGDGAVSVAVEKEEEAGEDGAEEAAPVPVPREFRRRPTPGVTRYVVLRVPRRVPRNRLTVRFDRRDPCRRCGGTGVRKAGDEAAEDWTACPTCWGVGHVSAPRSMTIQYRSRRVLGGQLFVPHEGDAGDYGGPRGNLILNIVTPDHTWRGVFWGAVLAGVLFYVVFVLPFLMAVLESES